MKSSVLVKIGLVCLIPIAGIGIYLYIGKMQKAPKSRLGPILPVTKDRLDADEFYAKRDLKGARKAYESIIKENSANPSKKVQDEVAAAKMRLGYVVAKTDGYAKARKVFLEADKSYKGTKSVDPEFGALNDQAAYQAAVCLVAQGKKEEARKEFAQIIKERPKSPVIYQAFRRINRLGDPNKAEQEIMQSAISTQEKWMKFEMSVCGPKSIVYLLQKLGKPAKGYKEVAKLCHTTEQGTTMQGMREGLKSLGIETTGLMVNRNDLDNIDLPAIWLNRDHYTVITSIKGNTPMVFDTRFQSQRAVKLPGSDDPSFMATVLVVSKSVQSTDAEGTQRR